MSNRIPRTRAAVGFVVLALGVASCGDTTSGSRRDVQAAHAGVGALRVKEAKVPKFLARDYVTRGTYPQVADGATRLAAVNAALTAAVRSEQRRYGRVVRRRRKYFTPRAGAGLFQTNLDQGVTSASSIVVSTLIPMTERFPGGTGGQVWLSATVRVPSGKRVSITDLFIDPARGLRALAAEVRTRLLARNSCIRQFIVGDQRDPSYTRGFAPTKGHYQYFALAPRGLVIGFVSAQVSNPTCNRATTTVPYAALRTEFSALAKQLIAGTRY
jgi:hypothetical protein